MNTSFILLAQYGAKAVIPVATVVRDYFSHLTPDKFLRKVALGEITIPLLRIEAGPQKAARGVHTNDLAQYLDDRRAAAIKEAKQLAGDA